MNKFLKDKINERLKHYDDLSVKLDSINDCYFKVDNEIFDYMENDIHNKELEELRKLRDSLYMQKVETEHFLKCRTLSLVDVLRDIMENEFKEV